MPLLIPRPPRAPLFPYTTLFRSILKAGGTAIEAMVAAAATIAVVYPQMNGIGGDAFWLIHRPGEKPLAIDRKSTRLNSSHVKISYAVFRLQKKTREWGTPADQPL